MSPARARECRSNEASVVGVLPDGQAWARRAPRLHAPRRRGAATGRPTRGGPGSGRRRARASRHPLSRRPPRSREPQRRENVPASTMTSTPTQHSSTGTATWPMRSMTPRARGGARRPGRATSPGPPRPRTRRPGRPGWPRRRPGRGGCTPPGCRPRRTMVTSAAAVKLRPTARCSGRRRRRPAAAAGCGLVRLLGPAGRHSPTRPRRPMASGTSPRSPTTAAENSKSRAAAAAATATSTREADHLPGGDAVGPLERRAGHHGHGHHAVVDVGPDERRRGDAEVGPQAGRQGGRQPAGSGIAGPKGLSPRRVTRCA